MNCKITLFENECERSFNTISGQEEQSLMDTINNFIIDEDQYDGIEINIMLHNGIEIPYGIICNAHEDKINKFLNKKTIVNPPQYGLHSWGKVQLLIELMDENEIKICEEIINKIKEDKIKLNALIDEQTESLKNMKLKKSSKKKKNNDNVSISSISQITTISDISLSKECSKTVRKCSKCKLPGHNSSKFIQNNEAKDTQTKDTQTKDTKTKDTETKDTKTKVIRKCSNCKLHGHNINKCPMRNSITSNIVPDSDLDSDKETTISDITDNDNNKDLTIFSKTKEKEKTIRKCSKCNEPGHTIRKCPSNF